jgi:hypothetical protein
MGPGARAPDPVPGPEKRLDAAPAAALLAALLAAVPAAAGAQPYDPRLEWRTLETPHFRIHFYPPEEALARRAAGAFEKAHELLVPFLRWDPGVTHVVLADDSDDANGNATPFPYNTIRLVATPPDSLSELNDHSDWLLSLAAHEYVHILQLDTVEGVPAVLAGILGKVWLPNALVPPWLTEGMAVLHESGPGHGRNASALFDMYARAIAVEGGLWPLHLASNPPLDWPLGNAWYLLGGRFLSFLAERHGTAALSAFTHEQGAWVWPFAIGVVAEHTLGGEDFLTQWGEFSRALEARYAEQLAEIRRRPVTPARWLTRRGARVLNPRWSPDGSFVAFHDQGLDGPAGLRRVTPQGRDLGLAAQVDANGTFALRSPREAIVAATDYFEYYWFWSDLWRVDLSTGERTRLTRGERATDPDVRPGGPFVAYAARVAPGELALRRLWIDSGRIETLFRAPGAQVYLPRISPDGRRIAFEVQVGARRDLAVWEDGRVARVTDDDALDVAPAWLPDGRLLFASDRGGVYNLYAFEPGAGGWSSRAPRPATEAPAPDPATLLSLVPPAAPARPTPDGAAAPPVPVEGADRPHAGAEGPGAVEVIPGRLLQVTNAETGALQADPSPDGNRIAYVSYSRAGYDLALLDVEPSAWVEPAPATPRPAGLAYDRDPAHPVVPYDPLPTLAPRFWLPVFGWDAAGFTLGGLTAGRDAVALHSWALDLRWSFGTSTPVYDLAYVGAWLRTPLALGSARRIASAPGVEGVLEEVWTPLRASLLVPFREIHRDLQLSAGWSGTFFRALGAPGSALALQDGFRSLVSASIAYDDTRRFVNSISRVSGVQATATAAGSTPALGSDYDYALGLVAANGYVRLPGTRQVVLALHLACGTSAGDFGGQLPFSLGGIPPPDVLNLALAAVGLVGPGAMPDQLRGYPAGAFAGSHLVSGTLELRFPIVAPQWGYSTWPAFLRRISGAAFLDVGRAWVPAEGIPWWQRLRFGAGGELDVEIVLGFYLPLDLRIGVAQGLGPLLAPGSPPDPYAGTQVYVTLGQAF